MRIFLYSPKDMIAGALALAAVIAIIANALLMQAAPHDKKSLRNLADARAQAVYEQILAAAPDLADRIFVVAPKLDADGIEGGGAATRVDFALH